jgi:hypothetical protein
MSNTNQALIIADENAENKGFLTLSVTSSYSITSVARTRIDALRPSNAEMMPTIKRMHQRLSLPR